MIGYDLDGVIAVEKGWWNVLYRTVPGVAIFIRGRYRPRCIPKGEFVIITNRPKSDRKGTDKWLKRHRVDHSGIYFADVRDPFGFRFKEKCIKELGIKRFFESDESIAWNLSRCCPGTEVIHVK